MANATASDDDNGDTPPPEHTIQPSTGRKLGATHFIIHARKCLLKGLTTKQNRSVPPLHYDWVYRLLDDFPHLDFSINGGVLSLKQADDLLKRRSDSGRQVRGVMIGRLLTKAPWVFHYIDQFFYDVSNPSMSPYDTIMAYVEFCEEMARKVGVACVPGSSFFRENVRGIVRLHFAKKDETLFEALERLSGMARIML